MMQANVLPVTWDSRMPVKSQDGLFGRWRAARHRRNTQRKLAELPDYILFDIGLTRGDLLHFDRDRSVG